MHFSIAFVGDGTIRSEQSTGNRSCKVSSSSESQLWKLGVECRDLSRADVSQPGYEFGGVEIVVRALIVFLPVLHGVKAKKRICQEQQTITDVGLCISYA